MGTTADLAKINNIGKSANISMPDRGTGTGLNGGTYGANISPDATNSLGSIASKTGSSPALNNTPGK